MSLPVHKISTDWKSMPAGLTYYFIGQPKSGKSTNSASWSEKGSDGVLLIDTDLGGDFVDKANVVFCTSLNPPYRKVMVDGVAVKDKDGSTKYEVIPQIERGLYHRAGALQNKPCEAISLIEVFLELKNNWDSLPYDTIVIDTVDEVNKWIEDIVTDELGIDVMGQGQWGADWGKARRKHLDIIKQFQNLIKQKGGNLIIISHSKQSAINDGKVQLSPDLPRGLGYALTAKADVIGYTTGTKDSDDKWISFLSYDERTVGSRLKPLANKTLRFDYKTIRDEILTYNTKEKEKVDATI
tara:strand:+ start:522 stop:1412 length:891 start_codon:yes stop_codon:yes gene_type:complete